jgi:hypothetical protein
MDIAPSKVCSLAILQNPTKIPLLLNKLIMELIFSLWLMDMADMDTWFRS